MNTPTSHPREDEAADYVFGQMDAAERIAFVNAMNQDETLRALVDELNQTATAFVLDAPQVPAPVAVRERVLMNVKTIAQDGAARSMPLVMAQAKRSGAWTGWAAAAAIAIVGTVLCNQQKAMRLTAESQQHKTEGDIAKLQKSMTEMQAQGEAIKATLAATNAANDALKQSLTKAEASSQAFQQQLVESSKTSAALQQELALRAKSNEALKLELASLTQANDTAQMQIAMLQSTVKEYKQGVAVVVWNSAKQEGILKLEKMPPVEAGKDYQLWVVDPSKKTPVNAGVVRVDDKGFAKVDFKPTLDIQNAKNFALSVEKQGGVAENEGPIVLLSP